jgi:hypothetical protein
MGVTPGGGDGFVLRESWGTDEPIGVKPFDGAGAIERASESGRRVVNFVQRQL